MTIACQPITRSGRATRPRPRTLAHGEPYHRVGGGEHKVIGLHGWFGDRTAFAALGRTSTGRRSATRSWTTAATAAPRTSPAATPWRRSRRTCWRWPTRWAGSGSRWSGTRWAARRSSRCWPHAPRRVRALVGIAPVPASGVPFDEQAWALFSGAVDEPANRRAIVDFTTGNRLSGVWLDAMAANSVRVSARAAVAGYLDAWAQGDFHERIAGNPVPVQVLVGEHDPALWAATMEQTWLKWYPNARLETLRQRRPLPGRRDPDRAGDHDRIVPGATFPSHEANGLGGGASGTRPGRARARRRPARRGRGPATIAGRSTPARTARRWRTPRSACAASTTASRSRSPPTGPATSCGSAWRPGAT